MTVVAILIIIDLVATKLKRRVQKVEAAAAMLIKKVIKFQKRIVIFYPNKVINKIGKEIVDNMYTKSENYVYMYARILTS